MAVILRPGKTPDGSEVALVLRHVVRAIRARWPAVEILVRGDSHYSRSEALIWLERNRVGYIFGLAGNKVLLAKVVGLVDQAAVSRVAGEAVKVRRYGEFRYAAKTWPIERRVVARIEASPQGSDTRFIVTNLKGVPPRVRLLTHAALRMDRSLAAIDGSTRTSTAPAAEPKI